MQQLKYILYARKSTEGEDRQVQSIDAQLNVLTELADRFELNIVASFEESKSAKSPFQRPKFSKMIEMINQGKANGILCWQINRLSRNPAESGLIQQLLQDEKLLSIQTHDREYLPDDNAVIFSIEASISNQFIRDLRKNVRRGIAQKVRNGGISGVAPEGYMNDRIRKTIVPDPKRFPLVRKAFDLFLTGNYTAAQVRDIMNDEWGYTTIRRNTRGGGPISRNSMYNLLRNPRYAGKIPDPYLPGKMIDANFKPVITVEEYDRVQNLLGDAGRPRLCASKSFALKGFIRCGECGCMITAETKQKRLVSGKINYHTYYHRTRKRPCSQR